MCVCLTDAVRGNVLQNTVLAAGLWKSVESK